MVAVSWLQIIDYDGERTLESLVQYVKKLVWGETGEDGEKKDEL